MASTLFSLTISHTKPDVSDAAGQHGLDHPSVVVDLPVLECECTEYSDVNIEASSCREGGEVYFVVSARGLVPWFVYELEIKWPLDRDELMHTWKSVVMPDTDSYTLREPLVQAHADFHFGMMAWDAYKQGNNRFVIGLTVRDMYPGLTTEEALIGIRNIDSSVALGRLNCMKHEHSSSESGTAGVHTLHHNTVQKCAEPISQAVCIVGDEQEIEKENHRQQIRIEAATPLPLVGGQAVCIVKEREHVHTDTQSVLLA